MIVKRSGQPAAIRLAESLVWLWRACKGWAPQVAASLGAIFSLIWAGYGDAIWAEGAWAFVVAVGFGLLSLILQIVLQRPTYMELSRREEEAVLESVSKSEAIGDAWESSSAVVELPETRPRWNQRLEKHHGFPKGTAAALTMHSQSIAALRIASNGDSVGVIVFESTVKERATQDTLDALEGSMLYATLRELVATVATLTPRVQEAAKEDPQPTPKPQLWQEVRASAGR